MARFMVFAGDTFYPQGGMLDFCGASDEKDDAIKHALDCINGCFANNDGNDRKMDWAHVYDSLENGIVYSASMEGTTIKEDHSLRWVESVYVWSQTCWRLSEYRFRKVELNT